MRTMAHISLFTLLIRSFISHFELLVLYLAQFVSYLFLVSAALGMIFPLFLSNTNQWLTRFNLTHRTFVMLPIWLWSQSLVTPCKTCIQIKLRLQPLGNLCITNWNGTAFKKLICNWYSTVLYQLIPYLQICGYLAYCRVRICILSTPSKNRECWPSDNHGKNSLNPITCHTPDVQSGRGSISL